MDNDEAKAFLAQQLEKYRAKPYAALKELVDKQGNRLKKAAEDIKDVLPTVIVIATHSQDLPAVLTAQFDLDAAVDEAKVTGSGFEIFGVNGHHALLEIGIIVGLPGGFAALVFEVGKYL